MHFQPARCFTSERISGNSNLLPLPSGSPVADVLRKRPGAQLTCPVTRSSARSPRSLTLACLCSCAETKNNFAITGSLPISGTVNTPYSGTLVAKGSNGGDTWTITGLPDGVTAPVTSGATLAVSGTPTAPGTYAVSATVSDVKGETKTYAATVIIAGQPLQITPAVLGNFTSGQSLSGTTFTASPATQGPYTWQLTSGALPAGLRFSDPAAMRAISGENDHRTNIQTVGPSVTITGTPTNSGAYFFTLSVADAVTPTADTGSQAFSGLTAASTTACAGAPLPRGNESALTQPYAFLVQGQDENDLPIAYAGSFKPDGNGGVTLASVDFEGAAAGPQSLPVNLGYSSYSFDSTGRGCLYLVFKSAVARPTRVSHRVLPNLAVGAHASNSSTRRRSGVKPNEVAFDTVAAPIAVTLSFSLNPALVSGGMIEFDDTGDADDPLAAGQIHRQDPSAFSLASLATNFSYGLTGWYTLDEQMLDRTSLAGNFTQSAGVVSNGVSDANIAGNYIGEQIGGTGTLGPISASTGRGESMYSVDVSGTTLAFQYAYYVIDANDYFVISTDSSANVGSFLISGRAIAAASSTAPMNGSYLAEWSGLDSTAGGNYAAIGILQAGTDGSVASFAIESNDAGDTADNTYSGSYALNAATARVTFAGFTGPVVYLTGPGSDSNITGFLVGSDAFTSSGLLAVQSAEPNYSNASLGGAYAMGSLEDITGQSATVASQFVFDGEGDYSGVVDVDTSGYQAAGQPISGSYTIDPSGFGEIGGGFLCVTNGTLILAMDSSAPDPLVYMLDAGPQPK